MFRYAEGTNPNGSINDIAGIVNENGNVLGLMPHPENLIEAAHGGTDGRGLFESALGISARRSSLTFPFSPCWSTMRLTTRRFERLHRRRRLLLCIRRRCGLASSRFPPASRVKTPANPGGPGKSASLRVMEQVAIAAHKCWIASKDPAFKAYRMANELNSFSGTPRFLLVPKKNYGGKPLLVVQARGNSSEVEVFGPLMSEAARRADRRRCQSLEIRRQHLRRSGLSWGLR